MPRIQVAHFGEAVAAGARVVRVEREHARDLVDDLLSARVQAEEVEVVLGLEALTVEEPEEYRNNLGLHGARDRLVEDEVQAAVAHVEAHVAPAVFEQEALVASS